MCGSDQVWESLANQIRLWWGGWEEGGRAGALDRQVTGLLLCSKGSDPHRACLALMQTGFRKILHNPCQAVDEVRLPYHGHATVCKARLLCTLCMCTAQRMDGRHSVTLSKTHLCLHGHGACCHWWRRVHLVQHHAAAALVAAVPSRPRRACRQLLLLNAKRG